MAAPYSSTAGLLRRYIYLDLPGSAVTNLLYGTNTLSGLVTFPSLPDQVELIPLDPYSGTYVAESQQNISDNYGSYLPGYIEPPETGNYIFWLEGDDESQLWLTTNAVAPLDPAQKQMIAWVPGYSGVREWGKYTNQQSVPVHLEKGKQYYFEALQKDATGGDFVGFGWTLPSGIQERPLRTFYLQPVMDASNDLNVVSGPFGGVVTPQSPVDPTLYDGMELMLFANINLTPPYTVQWLREATEITGATQSYYKFRVHNSDNGVNFYVRVNGTLYGPYTLTVTPDGTAPTVTSATVSPNNPTLVQLVFSEEVTAASATNKANYTINDATVQSATLQTDGRTVLLKTTVLAQGSLHVLTINNIQDMASPANTIAPNTKINLVVTEGALSFRYWDRNYTTDLTTLRAWSSNAVSPASYVSNLFDFQTNITTTSYPWNLVPARDNYMGQMIGYLTPPLSGYYKFAIASDDHSILYLGSDDQPTSKRELCFYNGSTGRWNTGAAIPNQQSNPVYLEAGKRYYFEAVYRDGTGGDGVSVFWQIPGGPTLPTANTSVQTNTEPFLISTNYLSTFATNSVQGALTFRVWYTTAATDLGSLMIWSGNPSYNNNQFAEERTITTSTYQWSLIPMLNYFEGQLIGYLTAPETGNYRFGVGADDNGILWLGTNELRSSKREICNVSASSGQWNLGLQTNQLSRDVYLEAGKRYYFEADFRDATGGDGVTVVWYTPTMAGNFVAWPPSPANNQAATTPYLIPASYFSTYSSNNFGTLVLRTDLPPTFSAAESTQPTLSVLAAGSPAFAYQWLKNGAPIAGAGAASYKLPYVAQADNNAMFQVIVTNSFSSVTSVVAVLTVTNDTVKPSVVSVGSLYRQAIEVSLSEPVTSATVNNLANYTLLGSTGAVVAVTGVVVDPNNASHITLQTAPMPETDLMKLVVRNLADLSATANVMNPATNTFRANNFDAFERINNTQPYSASAVGDQITMTSGGSDIAGTSDQCAYLYKTLTGNFDYRVRADSLAAINAWTKTGPMARVDTTAGARNMAPLWTPVTPGQNTFTAQVRETTGGTTTTTGDATPFPIIEQNVQTGVALRPTVFYPSWLRLQRVGSAVYYYYSTYGTNWTLWTWYDSTVSASGPLPATIQMGLALTSHDTARTVTAALGSFSAVEDGTLRFTRVPTNVIVLENGTANFSATVAGHSPWWFQWSTNDVAIVGATNTSITFTAVPFVKPDTKVTCRVTNPYGEVISTNAYIIVQMPDTNPPSVATVGSLFKSTVEVNFTEGVTATSASTLANYSLYASDGTLVDISWSEQDSTNAAHVTLHTAELPETDRMRLVCRNMQDLSLAGNVMPVPQTNAFRANNFDMFERINNTQNFTATAVGEQILMTSGGSDIWGTADQCAFLYKNVSGDFDYKVQGISLPAVNAWCKMGLMARVSTVAADRNVFSGFTPVAGQNTYAPQVRDTAAGNSTSTADAATPLMVNLQAGITARPPVAYPSWLRIQRVGPSVYYYYGSDGTNWTFWTWYDSAASASGALPDSMLLGLALTSHDTAQTVDGVMSSFSTITEGPLRFLKEPVSVTVEEGGSATFTAQAAGRSPLTYQWIKNGTDIPAATATNLVLTHIPISDNGATFACRVSNPFGDSLTSSNAILTVLQDTDKPVAYAVGSLYGNGIGVYFSDPNLIDPVSAGNPANYVVNGGAVSVTNATVEPDRLAVMLALNAPVSGDFSVHIQNVTDGAPIPNTIAPITLSSTVVTWPYSVDVGTVGTNPPALSDPIMPGFAQAIGTDGFYVHAGGHDIWDAADGMHFVYQHVTGSFDVAVRVAGLLAANTWSKAGLMVREDLGADARNYMVAATPTTGQNLISMQWRPDKAAASLSVAGTLYARPSPIPNAWLRITRTNQDLAFYYGTNGTDWATYYTTNLAAAPYPSTVYVGMATSSHDNGNTLTNVTGAYYRNLRNLEPYPTLLVSLSGTNVVISWAASYASLKLQYTPDLVPANWQPVLTAPVVNGNTYTVREALTGSRRFYRLSQ